MILYLQCSPLSSDESKIFSFNFSLLSVCSTVGRKSTLTSAAISDLKTVSWSNRGKVLSFVPD